MLCGAGFTPAAAQQAASDGVRLVRDHEPYGVTPWLLFQSGDPMRAIRGRAGIDAVIVETPYERVRYQAYLQALQGFSVPAAMVQMWRRQAENEAGFIIYAHSRSQLDRKFLQRFRPHPAVIFGPSDDFFDVGTFREERWVGSLTYRFRVRRCTDAGAFSFTGPYGTHYRLPYDLRAYR
jgi:hypothetical protein